MSSPKKDRFLHRAVRNFVFSGVGTVSNFALGFLFAGLTIRYLGEARAGFFMAMAALTGLGAFLGDFGLGAPAIRRVAALNTQGDFATARKVTGSVLTVSLATSLVIAVPLLVFFPKIFVWSRLASDFRADAFYALLMTVCNYLLTQGSYAWRGAFNSLERYDLISLFSTVSGLLTGLMSIAVLLYVPTMSALAAVRLVLALARFLFEAEFVRRLLGGAAWPTWDWPEIRSLAAFGGWVYAEDIGTVLMGRANSLLLTTFLGSEALPYYELPQRFYNQVHSALGNQSQFIFPMLASYGPDAVAEVRRLEDRLRWFLATASGAIYTGLALAGPALLSRLVSPGFATKAQLPLDLACIQGFFQAQGIVPSYISYALGWGKPTAIIRLTQGGLALLTGLILIPKLGFVGASLGQLWVVVTFFIHTIWVRRLVGRDLSVFGWLGALGSPLVMILAWLLVSHFAQNFFAPNIFGVFLAVALGGLVGLGSLLAIEAGLCRSNQRWATLARVIELPLQKLARLAK